MVRVEAHNLIRIPSCWVLSCKWGINIIPSKAQRTSFKRGQKEQVEGVQCSRIFFSSMGIRVMCVCSTCGEWNKAWDSLDQSYNRLWSTLWMPGTEPESFARAASVILTTEQILHFLLYSWTHCNRDYRFKTIMTLDPSSCCDGVGRDS